MEENREAVNSMLGSYVYNTTVTSSNVDWAEISMAPVSNRIQYYNTSTITTAVNPELESLKASIAEMQSQLAELKQRAINPDASAQAEHRKISMP